MPDAYVLMYHRVCARSRETLCYFERGTAVEPEVFRAQLEYLTQRFELLGPAQWLSIREQAGPPVVVMTFDDAYRDVIDHVAPFTARIGIYAMAGHLAEDAAPCWVDEYYGILHSARRCRGPTCLTPDGSPGIDADLRWWVRGPPKLRLQATQREERRALLASLRSELDADGPLSNGTLYCSRSELRSLMGRGVEVGGHGLYHARLSDADPDTLGRELDASQALLDELGAGRPRTFCYPDGAWSPDAARAVADRGFDGAFTVGPGLAGVTTASFELPRYIVRNRPPSDPTWCSAFIGGSSA